MQFFIPQAMGITVEDAVLFLVRDAGFNGRLARAMG